MRSPLRAPVRWSRGLLSATLFLAVGPALFCLNVSVQWPPDPIPIAQKARITVLYDGKPSPNTQVKINQLGRAGDIAILITDADGSVILPELPPGRYFISATYTTESFRQSVEVCMAPCGDYGRDVVHFVPTTLYGPLRVLDVNALALSEVHMETRPMPDPGSDSMLAAAEQQPITHRLQDFRGVVQDISGAVIPGAWINVVVKGTGGKNHAASLYADKDGRFSAHLAPGDYVAFIQSPGFKTSVVSFTITPTYSASPLLIVLNVGSETTTVTITEARQAAIP